MLYQTCTSCSVCQTLCSVRQTLCSVCQTFLNPLCQQAPHPLPQHTMCAAHHNTHTHTRAHAAAQNRLRELAQDLLGPERWTPTAASSSAWSPSVLGLTKRDLLARLLVPAAAAEGLAMARWVRNQSADYRQRRGGRVVRSVW